jgi:hypothetical protein
MKSLEKLGLYLAVECNESFIDGNQLKRDISNMPRLKKFIFNIRSVLYPQNPIDLSTK